MNGTAGLAPAPSSDEPGDPPTPRHAGTRTARRAVLALLTLLVLLGWVGVATMLRVKWQDALNAEQRQNANLARVLAEQALRVVSIADQATLRLRDAVAAGTVTPGDLVRLANETGLAPRIVLQLGWVNAQGQLMGSNVDPDGTRVGRIDLSEREHVRAHLAPERLPPDVARPAADGLFIGKAVLGKASGRWSIQLSRRITGHDGQMLGVAVVSLDPGYFEEVFRSVALGTQGGASLLGTDLGIRARLIGGQSVGVGTQLKSNPSVQQAFGRPESQYIATASSDGVDRAFTLRRVGDYPLYVSVYTAVNEALADWRATLRVVVGLSVLLTLGVGLLVFGVLTMLRRIDQHHAALQASEARAQAANQAKGDFLAAISHELRTPLTSIRGFAELMEARLPDDKFRHQAGLIRKGAEQLHELLSEILDLSKVEAGAMTLNPRPVALQPLLAYTADFFRLAAQRKGLALELVTDPELPPGVVCDPMRVRQVLSNLLSNAIKFTETGSVTLCARVQGARLLLDVIDTGPGIPPELHDTVFERFRQANGEVVTRHGGTGLGLALSRGLAALMQGTLTLESAPGRGAAFTLAFPLRPAPVPVAEDPAEDGPHGGLVVPALAATPAAVAERDAAALPG